MITEEKYQVDAKDVWSKNSSDLQIKCPRNCRVIVTRCIARALLKDSPILILSEAAEMFDPLQERSITRDWHAELARTRLDENMLQITEELISNRLMAIE